MSFVDIYKGARVIEALENLAVSDPQESPEPVENQPSTSGIHFRKDGDFWRAVLNGEVRSRSTVLLERCVFSEWIPRIPGLYFSSAGKSMRELTEPGELILNADGLRVYNPWEKSRKIMGGIGSHKIAPNNEGLQLACLTGSLSASTGIPILLHPDDWDKWNLQEGSVLERIEAKWMPLPNEWMARFPSTRHIPRGVLKLVKAETTSQRGHINISPFAVMEYVEEDVILYDFVFVRADTVDQSYRAKVERFFDTYKTLNGRTGKYLTSADPMNPMWEAEYQTPQDLRATNEHATSYLSLLTARVRSESFEREKIEEVLQALYAITREEQTLFRYSEEIGINRSLWFRDGRMADSITNLVSLCLERDQLEELIDGISVEYPNLFTS